MSDKLKLVQKLTSQSDIWTVEDAMEHWWQNRHGGWRLTAVGLEAFVQYKIEHWRCDAPNLLLSPSLLLALDRKLTGPYYIQAGKKSSIIFFNGKEATMFELYGDLRKFIKALHQF